MIQDWKKICGFVEQEEKISNQKVVKQMQRYKNKQKNFWLSNKAKTKMQAKKPDGILQFIKSYCFISYIFYNNIFLEHFDIILFEYTKI